MLILAESNFDPSYVTLLYLLAAVLFILGLKMLSKVKTAARGNLISSLGMLLACAVTFLLINKDANPAQNFLVSLAWIAIAVAIGAAIGPGNRDG